MTQNYYQKFTNEKFRNCVYFLPDYMAHDIFKEFWKKYPFWKFDSWYSSEVSKITSVRNKLNLSLKYWFTEAKIVFCTCQGPQKWSKYHLKTILTTFSERNFYYGAIFVKINFCHAWKCMISRVFHRSGFWHL